MSRTYRSQLRMFLLGTVPLLVLAGISLTAPTASASTSWGWQYASWGSAYASIADSLKSFNGYTSDDKQDGYCVSVEMTIRNANRSVWGSAGVAGSVNCAKAVNKYYSGSPGGFDSRYPYVCDVELLQGSNDEANAGYMTLWRDGHYTAAACSLHG